MFCTVRSQCHNVPYDLKALDLLPRLTTAALITGGASSSSFLACLPPGRAWSCKRRLKASHSTIRPWKIPEPILPSLMTSDKTVVIYPDVPWMVSIDCNTRTGQDVLDYFFRPVCSIAPRLRCAIFSWYHFQDNFQGFVATISGVVTIHDSRIKRWA